MQESWNSTISCENPFIQILSWVISSKASEATTCTCTCTCTCTFAVKCFPSPRRLAWILNFLCEKIFWKVKVVPVRVKSLGGAQRSNNSKQTISIDSIAKTPSQNKTREASLASLVRNLTRAGREVCHICIRCIVQHKCQKIGPLTDMSWGRGWVVLVEQNKGDFCLRMLELFPGFSGFRTFHRTNKFERQKLITRTSKEDYPSTGRR